MASRENDDSQDLADFKQPPKKMTRFKHPSKEEEILALSKGFAPANTRKNTTCLGIQGIDRLASRKEQKRRRTVSSVISSRV